MPSTETFELKVEGLLGQEYVANVFHWQAVGSDPANTEASTSSLVDGWAANIRTLWLAMLPATYQMSMISGRRVLPKGSTVTFEQSVPGAYVGARGTNSACLQTAPCIFMIPPMGNKSGGKTFLPGIAQGDVVGNSFVAPFQTAVANFMAGVIAGFTDAGITWEQVIYSRKLGTSVPITDFHLSPLIGYQGKRRKAVGA